MAEDLNTALILLTVGMFTVFVILSLVVLCGKVLIHTLNYFSSRKKSSFIPGFSPTNQTSIPKTKVATIIATVDVLTGGKGQIKKIVRVN